ncbi:MAG: hypothetical protein HUJ26_00375 [Planctomycetaceae bacterium]|nr:hypothetical protein [Planctomycetaceae bacterium]
MGRSHRVLSAKEDGTIIFIDEAAELRDKSLQVALYLALDQRKILLNGQKKGTSPISIPIADVTLLLATTDEYELLQPLREGDEWISTHPICVLWTDKFDDLSRSRSLEPMQVNETLRTLAAQLAGVMREICDEANRDGHGTDWRNQHPRVQEIVRKLVAATGSREGMNVFEAFEKCEQLARQQSIEE